jgi:hypothetical protein
MTKKLTITLLLACLAGAATAWLLNKQPEQQAAPAAADTVLTFAISNTSGTPSSRQQKISLACSGSTPVKGTAGGNFGIKRQAREACGLLNDLPAGDSSCPSLSPGAVSFSVVKVSGVKHRQKFAAVYEDSSSRSCDRQRMIYMRASKVWSLSGKANAVDARQAAIIYKKELKQGKEMSVKRAAQEAEAKQQIQRQNQNNAKYLAKEAKTSNSR